MVLFHNTIRKYTAALLGTFNNLELPKTKSDGSSYAITVPLKFSSREKSVMLQDVDTSQLFNGNTSVIPRASLVFVSIQKAPERTTSKFNKIYKKISSENDTEVLDFNFNSSPFDFSYSLIIQTTGMNDASIIIEQIASKFNPIYNLSINETALQNTPTTVPLVLDSISFEVEDYEEYSSNIVTITVDLTLKGNIYPPVNSTSVLKNIIIYNNNVIENEFERVSRISLDKQLDETFKPSLIVFDEPRKVAPVVNNIVGNSTMVIESELVLICDFEDFDNKFSELTFNWEISQSSIPTEEIGLLEINKNVLKIISGVSTCSFTIECSITDIHGNTSNIFSKNINII